MPLKSDGEGSYTATWVPATSGTYLIQVFIDGKHTGKLGPGYCVLTERGALEHVHACKAECSADLCTYMCIGLVWCSTN